MERRSGTLRSLGSRKTKAKETVVSAELDSEMPGALDAFLDKFIKAKKAVEVEVLNIMGKELVVASPKLAGNFGTRFLLVLFLFLSDWKLASVCQSSCPQFEWQQVDCNSG